MERHASYADTPWLLLCLALMALVWTFLQLPPGFFPPKGGTATPTPTPTTRAGAPACQQDNTVRSAGTPTSNDSESQRYAQVVPDLTDRRYDRVITDQLVLSDRFDAGSVGPIVFRPNSSNFAFIATRNGQKYILGYRSASLTPYTAEPVQDAWKNWVCFGATGKYLFAIAKHNDQWHLDVRSEEVQAKFAHYLLNSEPAQLQVLPVRTDGTGEYEYAPLDAPIQTEIKSWLK